MGMTAVSQPPEQKYGSEYKLGVTVKMLTLARVGRYKRR